MNGTTFNAQELCSRKLWQIINTPKGRDISESELREAISELASSRHYLTELERIGKLERFTAES